LLNFNRWNEKYKWVFNILKWIAEETKKMLSYDEEVNVEIDKIGEDDSWNEIYLTFTVTREEFNKLIDPFVQKSIKLTEETIKEVWINKNIIEKIVLVWWSTMIPYIKEQLENQIWIQVDTSVDPLTVVAKWAAIYAWTQLIEQEYYWDNQTGSKDVYKLTLNYETTTTEKEEIVTWQVEWLESWKTYYIQIQSESWYYSSNKIQLKDWKFVVEIKVEEWKSNHYWIYLIDETWNSLPLSQDNFVITHWLTVWSIPIPENIW